MIRWKIEYTLWSSCICCGWTSFIVQLSYFSITVILNTRKRQLIEAFTGGIQFQRVHGHHGRQHGSRHCTGAEAKTLHPEPQTGREKTNQEWWCIKAFEISTAHPHWHTPNTATQSNLSQQFLQGKPSINYNQLQAYSSRSQKPPHHYSVSIFTFTDETKVIYKTAATQDTIPEAPEKGTHNGNVPTTQPSSSQNGLDSGQVEI